MATKIIPAWIITAQFEGKTGFWNGDSFLLSDDRSRKFEDKIEAEKFISRLVSVDAEWKRVGIAYDLIETTKEVTEYAVTGRDVYGKRFSFTTRTPQHYNLHTGNVWEILSSGKRKLAYSVVN